jgi:hypothetical protein
MKIIILTSLFIITLGVRVAHAAEDPKWEELNALFGRDIESDKVKQIVHTFDLSKAAKGDSGSFTPKHYAYTLMFEGDKISTIILRIAPYPQGYGEPNWRTYAGDLPLRIKPSSRHKDLKALFGKSHTKQGHSWISDGLNIWVRFNDDGAISEIYMSQADSKKKKPAQQDAP